MWCIGLVCIGLVAYWAIGFPPLGPHAPPLDFLGGPPHLLALFGLSNTGYAAVNPASRPTFDTTPPWVLDTDFVTEKRGPTITGFFLAKAEWLSNCVP